MPLTPEDSQAAIKQAVAAFPGGAAFHQIMGALNPPLPRRTLRTRILQLVDGGGLIRTGKGPRWIRYSLPAAPSPDPTSRPQAFTPKDIPISPAGEQIRLYLSQPLSARKPVGYHRKFLDAYRPNVSSYLTETQRQHLATIGQPSFAQQAAGTYARHILNRLLIDLSWNSSRLEGNTYSLLDTRRLLELGQEASGANHPDAQMILNHKQAIEFLVNDADEIGFNPYTLRNLHGILAQNLVPDPAAPGRLRQIPIGIPGSTFHPLELPQLIAECFQQVLATAAAIQNPFEQALFAMVQLPYLQPFDDVNKRVSRLAANIPFIRHNLAPLSFTDVPRDLYTQAVLGVYELNQVYLLRDVFVWAYERSAAQYTAVRQSLGEPDPFRFKYSAALRQVVSEVVRGSAAVVNDGTSTSKAASTTASGGPGTRGGMDKPTAIAHIAAWVQTNIPEADREPFRNLAEIELLSLHEGNFARYHVRPAEFAAWQAVWNQPLRPH